MQNGGTELHLRALGETLRALRVERGLSLGEVAEGTGLSSSFLSLVENGRSDISTGRLFRIAHFLGVGIGGLLDTRAPREPRIVRAGEGRPVEAGEGLRAFPVLGDDDDAAMRPALLEVESGARVAVGAEGGEHALLVIRGEVVLTGARDAEIALGPGDSAYLWGPAGEIRNPGPAPAALQIVSATPPARS